MKKISPEKYLIAYYDLNKRRIITEDFFEGTRFINGIAFVKRIIGDPDEKGILTSSGYYLLDTRGRLEKRFQFKRVLIENNEFEIYLYNKIEPYKINKDGNIVKY